MSTFDRVHEFHLAFNHPVTDTPNVSTEQQRLLRVKLIASELCELAGALGVNLFVNMHDGQETVRVSLSGNPGIDLVEVADALGDLDYVVNGGFHVFGIDPEAVGREIHASNMTKLGLDGKPILAADGKVIKGPLYREPNLESVLYGNASREG